MTVRVEKKKKRLIKYEQAKSYDHLWGNPLYAYLEFFGLLSPR